MADLVSLYRCKHCGVRMFERDCVRHLAEVHHRHIVAARILDHFSKGPKEIAATPGADYKPMYYQKQAKKPAAAHATEPRDPDPDDDLN